MILPANDLADGDAADVVAVVERDDQHLQRRVQVDVRRRHVLQDRVEQRLKILGRDRQVGGGDALAAGGVDDREVERGVVGVQLDEQVEDGVEHLGGPGVGAVDLVDDDDRPQPALERLAQHEARLRQRPSAASTSSRQPSAIFRTRSTSPPKSAWPGVSMRLILVSPSVEGDVLGQDGDAALAFQVVGVEDQAVLAADELVQLLAAKQAGLAQHLIDQGRFAVVNVGDDGDIANVVPLHSHKSQ